MARPPLPIGLPGSQRHRRREELRDRSKQNASTGIEEDSRFRVAAEEWIASVDQLVAQGIRSLNTAQLYRLNLSTHVLPALGELRLREITVPRLDRFVQTRQLHNGTATAKVARIVAS